MLIDSHCHLDDPRLLSLLPGVITDAQAAGVSGFVVPGVHPAGWFSIAALARTFPQVFPAFGVHPMHAELVTPDTLSELRHVAPFASAIGEVGLDYALPSPSREVQQAAFREQLAVAREAGIPVLIHCRKAFHDLLAILQNDGLPEAGGVMHAFSGSPETAEECLRLGLHISLAGTVTYSNAVRPVAVAASVPLERLLLETDAPDLSPEPHRGTLNLPSHLVTIARKVAEVRGLELEELARATTANATSLFRLDSRRHSRSNNQVAL